MLFRPCRHLHVAINFTRPPPPCPPSRRVHVRRTDKVGTEAAFHAVDEYMQHVQEFYERRAMEHGPDSRRCVYLASDDPSVFQDAVKK